MEGIGADAVACDLAVDLRAAGDRVLGLLDEKSRIPEATGAVRLEQFRDSIEFRDVSFSYDDSRKVIDSVSFTIRKGETVA